MLLVAVPSGARGQNAPDAAGPEVMDLESLLARAGQHYPRLHAAHYAIEAAEARLDEARISPFMQFTATAGFTMAPDAEGTPVFSPDGQFPIGNSWSPVAQARLRGAIPIYTFGRIRSGRVAARAGVRAAEAEREMMVERVRYDVRRAYFGLQLSLDLQVLLEDGLSKLRRAIERTDQLLADEDPSTRQSDRYRLAAALSEIEARMSQTLRLESSARAALQMLTGLERVEVPDCPLEPVDYDAEPLESYTGGARGARPELNMLDAAIEAREAAVEAEWANYFPMFGLGLSARYSYGPGRTDIDNPFITDPSNYSSFGGSLFARWNLDFYGTMSRVRRARALLEETRSQSQEARQGVELEVTLAYERLRDAGRRQEVFARGERDTRAWFVSAAQAYQLGTVEPKELIDALKAYFTARFSHLEAVREFNTTVADLERASALTLVSPGGWEIDCTE